MDRTSKTHILTLDFFGRLGALCIMACLVAVSSANAADADRPRRVMMLSTENRFAPAFILAEQAVMDGLRTGLGPIEFYAEYLDRNRFPGKDHQSKFADYLRKKYAQRRPDLLVIFYARTLETSGSLASNLFRGVPTVAVGVKLPKLFEPFFMTKQTGMGMGLARTIVEQHHGQIWAENNRHVGATLYFTVPGGRGE